MAYSGMNGLVAELARVQIDVGDAA